MLFYMPILKIGRIKTVKKPCVRLFKKVEVQGVRGSAAERTLNVREQREPKRNAADWPLSTAGNTSYKVVRYHG